MEEGADELVFLDITASAERRRTMLEWVSRVADTLFLPFTVGGGISAVEQAREIVALGADKISLNTAAVRKPQLIADCARLLGRQAVVLAVDAKETPSEAGRSSSTGGALQPDWTFSNGSRRARASGAARSC